MKTNMKTTEVKELSLTELHPFEGHPYKVRDDEEMDALVESVVEHGIMAPLIVRPIDTGFEIVSGHRRAYAAMKAGLKTVPVIEVSLTRDEAAVALVDSNLNREHILPSEKAFAYKLKLEALARQGKHDMTCGQVGHKSRDDIDDTESGRQVQRYIRLTHLIPDLLRLVDEERIAFTPAVELSYLSKEEQQLLSFEIGLTDATPSLSQAVRMKRLSGEGHLTEETIASIMAEEKPNQRDTIRIPFSALKGKVPERYSDRERTEFMIKAVDHYYRHLMRQREVR
jgi:ParB family chromosome partitioning protein